MNIERMVKKLERDATGVYKVVDEPLKQLIRFVKKHKKLILVIAVGYFVYNYLFSEEDWDQ